MPIALNSENNTVNNKHNMVAMMKSIKYDISFLSQKRSNCNRVFLVSKERCCLLTHQCGKTSQGVSLPELAQSFALSISFLLCYISFIIISNFLYCLNYIVVCAGYLLEVTWYPIGISGDSWWKYFSNWSTLWYTMPICLLHITISIQNPTAFVLA